MEEAKAGGKRLASKDVRAISTTCQVVDNNNKRLVVYISEHTRQDNGKVTKGGVCVSGPSGIGDATG